MVRGTKCSKAKSPPSIKMHHLTSLTYQPSKKKRKKKDPVALIGPLLFEKNVKRNLPIKSKQRL